MLVLDSLELLAQSDVLLFGWLVWGSLVRYGNQSLGYGWERGCFLGSQ